MLLCITCDIAYPVSSCSALPRIESNKGNFSPTPNFLCVSCSIILMAPIYSSSNFSGKTKSWSMFDCVIFVIQGFKLKISFAISVPIINP